MTTTYHGPPPGYCRGCCGKAAPAGRAITASGYCTLCDQRRREGLVVYRPSNGSEGRMFFSHCDHCRHNIDVPDNPKPGSLAPPYTCCQWGIMDRLMVNMCFDREHISAWHDPANLDTSTCPATCRRYTPKDYGSDDRDPPSPVDPNQMTFDDLDIPVERVPPNSYAWTRRKAGA